MGHGSKTYRGCIEWLESAGIVNVCHCLSFPELPLKGNYDENKYKIYCADSGLFVSMLDDEANDDLRANRNLGVYKGCSIREYRGRGPCARAGMSCTTTNGRILRWRRISSFGTRNNLVPVEVKVRNGSAKSMRTLLSSDSYPDIQFGIKLSAGNVGSSDGLLTLPYFIAFLLRRLFAGI